MIQSVMLIVPARVLRAEAVLRLLLCFSLAIFCPGPTLASPQLQRSLRSEVPGWRNLGHEAAFVFRVVFDPSDPEIVLVGTDDGGGVWRSEDGGQSFHHISTDLIDVSSWALTLDPRAPRRIYAGDAYGRGVYLSRDGGDTWAFSNIGLSTFEAREVTDLVVDPVDSSSIYAATQAGLFFSRDYGATWQRAGGGPQEPGRAPVYRLAAERLGARTTLYAATGELYQSHGITPSLFRSDDRGASWTDLRPAMIAGGGAPVPGSFVSDIVPDPRSPGKLYVAMWGSVLVSPDAGGTFNRLNLDPQAFFPTIALDPRDARVLDVAGGARPGPIVWHSIDGGATFSSSGTGIDGSYPLSMTRDPWNPDRLLLGMFGDLFVSLDAGANWALDNLGLTHSCAQSLAFSNSGPSDPATLYVGFANHSSTFPRRNAFRHLNGVWTELGVIDDTHALATFPDAPGHVLAGTFSKGLYYSTDDGISFSPSSIVGGPREIQTVGLWAGPAGLALAGGADPSYASVGLFRSTDGGRSFVPVFASLVPFDFERVGNRIYAVGLGGVAASDDLGATWNVVLQDDRAIVMSVIATTPDGRQLLVGDDQGQLRMSADGGVTWSDLNSPFTGRGWVSELLVDPADGAIYAGLFSGNVFTESLDRVSGLFRSRDGGQSWISLNGGAELSSHITEMVWHPQQPGILYASMWCSGVSRIDVRALR